MNKIYDEKLLNKRELSFSRLIVVPLFFIDFVGVRKENERLTAIPSELFQKYSLENRSGRFHLLLGLE